MLKQNRLVFLLGLALWAVLQSQVSKAGTVQEMSEALVATQAENAQKLKTADGKAELTKEQALRMLDSVRQTFGEPRILTSNWGVPRRIWHPLGHLPMAQSLGKARSIDLVRGFFDTYSEAFGVDKESDVDFVILREEEDEKTGTRFVRVQELANGFPVQDTDMWLHFDASGNLFFFNGLYFPTIRLESAPMLNQDEAMDTAEYYGGDDSKATAASLVYVDFSRYTASRPFVGMAWKVFLVGKTSSVQYIDAVLGSPIATYPLEAYLLPKSVLACQGKKALGTQCVAPTPQLDATIQGYLQQIENKWASVGWNSYDNLGSELRVYHDYGYCESETDNVQDGAIPATNWACGFEDQQWPYYSSPPPPLKPHEVHLGFWYSGAAYSHPTQAGVVGSGHAAGVVLPGGTPCLDMVAHEFGHAMNDAVTGLPYWSREGAVSEHLADCFAAMVDDSDWTLFEDCTFNNVYPGAKPTRDMSNPLATNLVGGTPAFSFSPDYAVSGAIAAQGHQPAHFGDYAVRHQRFYTPLQGYPDNAIWYRSNDFHGAHENSGVGNKACYLLGRPAGTSATVMGVAVTALGREETFRLYHETQRYTLTSTTNYSDLRELLAYRGAVRDILAGDPAFTRYRSAQAAMDAVGVWEDYGLVGGLTGWDVSTEGHMSAGTSTDSTGDKTLSVWFRNAYMLFYFLKDSNNGSWTKINTGELAAGPPTVVPYTTTGPRTGLRVFYWKPPCSGCANKLYAGDFIDPIFYPAPSNQNLGVTFDIGSTAPAVAGIYYNNYYYIFHRDSAASPQISQIRYSFNLNQNTPGGYMVTPQGYPKISVRTTFHDTVAAVINAGRVWIAFEHHDMQDWNTSRGVCITSLPLTALEAGFGALVWPTPTCLLDADLPGSDPQRGHSAPGLFTYAPGSYSPWLYMMALYGTEVYLPEPPQPPPFPPNQMPYYVGLQRFWGSSSGNTSYFTRFVPQNTIPVTLDTPGPFAIGQGTGTMGTLDGEFYLFYLGEEGKIFHQRKRGF